MMCETCRFWLLSNVHRQARQLNLGACGQAIDWELATKFGDGLTRVIREGYQDCQIFTFSGLAASQVLTAPHFGCLKHESQIIEETA